MSIGLVRWGYGELSPHACLFPAQLISWQAASLQWKACMSACRVSAAFVCGRGCGSG